MEKDFAPRAVYGKHEGKRLLGRPGCRWEKMDLEETGWESVNWMCLWMDM
jgi:hypothetical protein